MQQLSGLDASFLYFETPKSPGHVFSVYIYDQSSAPGGDGHVQGDPRPHREASPRVARRSGRSWCRCRWARSPVLDRGPRLRPRVPRAPHRAAEARRLAPAHASRSRGCTRAASTGAARSGRCTSSRASTTSRGLPAGSFAIMTKIHHAAVDGVTPARDHRARSTTRSPTRSRPRPTTEWKPEAEPSARSSCWRAPPINNTTRPLRFARLMARTTSRGAERCVPPRRAPRRRHAGRPGAAHALQRDGLGAQGRRGAPVRAGHRQADQERRARCDHQRRRDHRGRRRAAQVPAREGRAARRSRCG